jgi:hypothetical protein
LLVEDVDDEVDAVGAVPDGRGDVGVGGELGRARSGEDTQGRHRLACRAGLHPAGSLGIGHVSRQVDLVLDRPTTPASCQHRPPNGVVAQVGDREDDLALALPRWWPGRVRAPDGTAWQACGNDAVAARRRSPSGRGSPDGRGLAVLDVGDRDPMPRHGCSRACNVDRLAVTRRNLTRRNLTRRKSCPPWRCR